MLLFLLACSIQETPSLQQSTTQKNDTPFENLDQGQKHPPLPIENPNWEWDPKAFVPDYGWFGEHSWMDVRMRVAGHLSAAGRDKARLYAMQKNWSMASTHYQEIATILKAIPTATTGTSKEINTLLANAAQRDAQILNSIAKNSPFLKTSGLISPLRVEYYSLVLRYKNGDDVAQEAKKLCTKLQKAEKDHSDLDISNFTDFHSRHALRIRLFAAYLDALDPLYISEPWGYWTAEEIERQRTALGLACAQLGAEKSETEQAFTPAQGDPLLWPSQYLIQQKQSLDSSIEEFGALPTGDSLIDIASSPGPKGIGDLMKWGLNDKKHTTWLSNAAQEITQAIDNTPEKSFSVYKTHISYLEKGTHGSRFYNIKQLRNATIRQLARAGKYQMAHRVLQDHFPLHNQDWACPNREGILRAIDGRLLALAENPLAEETLNKAISLGTIFLQNVEKAEQGVLTTPKPPILEVGHPTTNVHPLPKHPQRKNKKGPNPQNNNKGNHHKGPNPQPPPNPRP
jgi:hypothetical protein